MITFKKDRNRPMPLLLALIGLLALSGCSSGGPSAADSAEMSALTISDMWVRTSDAQMTGSFGTITNNTDAPVTITAAANSASDRTELHEVVQIEGEATMQAKDGGFVIEAGESVTLEPGKDHIMLMGLKEPIEVGDEVTISLTLDNGETVEYSALAKDAAAGDEPYHENSDIPAMDLKHQS